VVKQSLAHRSARLKHKLIEKLLYWKLALVWIAKNGDWIDRVRVLHGALIWLLRTQGFHQKIVSLMRWPQKDRSEKLCSR